MTFGRWLAIKANFILAGTVCVGVGGFVLTVLLVDPAIRAGWKFWILMSPLYLLGGYAWAVGMWHWWYLPLKGRLEDPRRRARPNERT